MRYTNVLIRNWQAWRRLGVHYAHAPNGYPTWCAPGIPVSLGAYPFPSDPAEPIVVHLVRTPTAPAAAPGATPPWAQRDAGDALRGHRGSDP